MSFFEFPFFRGVSEVSEVSEDVVNDRLTSVVLFTFFQKFPKFLINSAKILITLLTKVVVSLVLKCRRIV